MRAIAITQFLRPNGEKRPLVCDVSDDVASLYEQVIAPSRPRRGCSQFRIFRPTQISGSNRAAFASASLPTCV
jgi:hypothetical protein